MNTSIPISEAALEEVQTARFKESLNEILSVKSEPKIEFSEKLIKSAKLNITQGLAGDQLLHLVYLGEAWNQNLNINRSGAGLVINFTLRTN
jgi:hypothetical protein